MALARTHTKFNQYGPPAVVGFWMTIEGADPADAPVRIIVTAGALERIDPSHLADAIGAAESFEKHRDLIEAVASNKFDEGHVEDETHEGWPLVRVSSDDLP